MIKAEAHHKHLSASPRALCSHGACQALVHLASPLACACASHGALQPWSHGSPRASPAIATAHGQHVFPTRSSTLPPPHTTAPPYSLSQMRTRVAPWRPTTSSSITHGVQSRWSPRGKSFHQKLKTNLILSFLGHGKGNGGTGPPLVVSWLACYLSAHAFRG